MPEDFSAGVAGVVVEVVEVAVVETAGVADKEETGVTVRYVGCELRMVGTI